MRASFLPTPYARSEFWTSSPAFFFLRVGSSDRGDWRWRYVWERRPAGGERWSPLQQLGRTSLFIYWIHVELVYGLISLPLHHALTLRQTWFALVAVLRADAGLLDREGPPGRPAARRAGTRSKSFLRSASAPVFTLILK